MDTKEVVLQNCTIEGCIIKLPNVQLERKVYQEVAKSLNLIGGTWKGGKVSGFVFAENPTELLAQIANGEKRNLKKEFQFFATPTELADRLVELAEIKPEHSVLEPSAGQGAIVNAIHKIYPEKVVFCCETMPVNISILSKLRNLTFVGEDFLFAPDALRFDRIIANPPFSGNQDIDHIRKMYHHLAKNGRLVSIASMHWRSSSNRKETEFKEWLKQLDANVEIIPERSFKESGTLVGGVIITIDKL
jgi:hypothetical protein